MNEYESSPNFSWINCAVTVRELPTLIGIDEHEPAKAGEEVARPLTRITVKVARKTTTKLELDPKWLLVTGFGD